MRTGNPDGGVEWYASLGDGTELGWQAKYIYHFDSLLAAMTTTVRRVVRDRPGLKQLTFVIPFNLNTGTGGGRRRSQREKYQDKVETWQSEIAGADKLSFSLVQESDLLERLALPRHRGREWFWWGSPVLANGWLKDHLAEQSEAAGQRYRPDLQVDLPIQADLDALALSGSAFDRFEQLRRAFISAVHEMRLRPAGSPALKKLHRAINAAAKPCLTAFASITMKASADAEALVPLRDALNKLIAAIYEAETLEHQLYSEWRESHQADSEDASTRPPALALGYSVREVRNSAGELVRWFESSEGQSFQNRFYFLTGPAGSGKTHLFLDAASRALSEDRPAVVLFGARLGRGSLWESICDQLGLGDVGADVLLGAMSAAGEAAALTGRRFLLLLDAVNETVPPDFWHVHLPALRSAIARWPHIALAVSCRDTYLEVVDDGSERRHYVTQTHPGFSGREVEATQKYFAHFGLETPRIPLLTPEFTRPLFLRMYCESLRDSGETPVGHEGRVRMFKRYLDAKLRRVARRLNPNAQSGYELRKALTHTEAVVNVLLDEFAASGSQATSIAKAEELATASMGGSVYDATIVLGALQDEGVLTRERLYIEGATEDGIRVAFQAFSDFLLLERRLGATSDPINDSAFKQWLSDDASWGIVEAAAVVLPELHGVELPDLLGITGQALRRPTRDNDRAWQRFSNAQSAFRSVLQTLPYRAASAITDRTIELINDGIGLFSPNELFRTMFQVAPQPENTLNAEALHRYLLQFPMPRRDSYFGFATYHEIWEESNPAAILARWAAEGPYPEYDPRVIELASIPLIWLLSSPNRFMRDWISKALVQLLRGHLDVVVRLVDRFWTVDDPYVVQRVIVIAYGALLRSDGSEFAHAKVLTSRIRRLVFTRPVRADEILLDAARGIVEFGVHHNLLPKTASRALRRPYGIAAPSSPPSEAVLKRKYGYREGRPIEKSYSTIYNSLMSLGDFGRYVVESGLTHFSRYRHDQKYPQMKPAGPVRLIKSRWAIFEKSLTKKQRQALAQIEDHPEEGLFRMQALLHAFDVRLTSRQRKLFEESWRVPRRKYGSDDYPSQRARRWVVHRTMTLGWTPTLFGDQDRIIAYGSSGRGEHKAERWGKKYQWIAYHELLARVADNFQVSRFYRERNPYEGLHQMIAEREIDPSLPPIPYRELTDRSGEGAQTWERSQVRFTVWPPGRIEFSPFTGDIKKFLKDEISEPQLDRVLFVTDQAGDNWIILDGYIAQSDPEAHKSWLGLQQIFAVDSWFVPKGQARDLLPKLASFRRHDPLNLLDQHGHTDCCYFRELGWTPHTCYNKHADFTKVTIEESVWDLAPTVETYMWEGSLLDCSIGETVRATAPSSFVQSRAELVHSDLGPAWLELGGNVPVFVNCRYDAGEPPVFLVRAEWLKAFLINRGLSVVFASWHERRHLTGDHRKHNPMQDVYSAAFVDDDLVFNQGEIIREAR